MSSDSDLPDVAGHVERVPVEDEMQQSYIDYAMSVIAGRAVPDVRDGLKPVHRRILYTMHEMGLTSGSAHRKSSSIVGQTMGDYHPHGDSAIYDTLARMAQDFSLRYPLIDGQGNFGSIDDDPPAAMRYTEARLEAISEEILEDIEKETVDFVPNYDDRLEEPVVLPAKVPSLLVNGSSGIAVGMSTNIPPHNLEEVVDAAIHVIENPDCDVRDLLDLPDSDGPIKGPDFPTGGIIVGRDGLLSAYETGRGRLRVRANYEIEENEQGRDRIIVTEIPFQANKARMVEKIADLVNNDEIEGISDLRDESDRDGIRIVIELNRGANTRIVENILLDRVFERTFGVINLALSDEQPRVFDLKGLLIEFINHRREVVRRRTEHDLVEAVDRLHILEGRRQALDHIEAIIDLIQETEDRDAAITKLQSEFSFSADQAEHIVRMQLGSLTEIEAQEIRDEYDAVTDDIARLEEILSEDAELLAVIKDELRELAEEYGDDRRTSIKAAEGSRDREDLIPKQDVVIVMTADDYVKRMPIEDFSPQQRGGKGIIGTGLKDDDQVTTVFKANTHDYLLCITNRGQIYRLKVYDIPEKSRTAQGRSAINLLDLDADEQLAAIVTTDNFEAGRYLTMVTRNGYVKRTSVEEFENTLSTGIIATRLEEDDELVGVVVTTGEQDVVISTEHGQAIRFDEADVRPMGRTARGVHGIDLADGDAVADVTAIDPSDQWILTITKNGYGKRTDVGSYRVQSRNGKGLIDIKTDERNGSVCSIESVGPGDHVVLMTTDGQIMRTPVEDISIVGRNTKGVVIIKMEGGDRMACLDIIEAEETAVDSVQADSPE